MDTIQLTTDQIDEAKYFLKKGELVAIPTETVYGLAAPIFSPDSVKKIFALKKRPPDNPLIVHVASYSMVESLVSHLPAGFDRLTRAFCARPSPTLILPCKRYGSRHCHSWPPNGRYQNAVPPGRTTIDRSHGRAISGPFCQFIWQTQPYDGRTCIRGISRDS